MVRQLRTATGSLVARRSRWSIHAMSDEFGQHLALLEADIVELRKALEADPAGASLAGIKFQLDFMTAFDALTLGEAQTLARHVHHANPFEFQLMLDELLREDRAKVEGALAE